MSETETTNPLRPKGSLTSRLTVTPDGLGLRGLADFLANLLKTLNSIERGMTGKRRAFTDWRISELSYAEGVVTITVASLPTLRAATTPATTTVGEVSSDGAEASSRSNGAAGAVS